jgi:dual specificity phosphatase 12
MNKIVDGIYLGTRMEARSIVSQMGGAEKITHILSVSEQAAYPNPGICPIKFLTMPMCDHGNTLVFEERLFPREAERSSIFQKACNFVDEALEENGTVLVHCEKGQNRSTTIVIALLMQREKWTFNEAYAHVSNIRPMISMHGKYIEQLRSFELQNCCDISKLVTLLLSDPSAPESLKVLRTVLQNNAKHPAEEKFRKLSMGKDKFRRQIAEKSAALNILLSSGWVWADAWNLSLPAEISANQSREAWEALERAIKDEQEKFELQKNEAKKTALAILPDDCQSMIARLLLLPDGSQSLSTVQLILQNIVDHPGESKYRTLCLLKDRVRIHIAEKSDAVALLKAAGWQWKDGENLTISLEFPVERIREIAELVEQNKSHSSGKGNGKAKRKHESLAVVAGDTKMSCT